MTRWRHNYPTARNYGWPFGTVEPNVVVEWRVNPAPPFFDRLDDEEEVVEAEVSKPEPLVKTKRQEVPGLSHSTKPKSKSPSPEVEKTTPAIEVETEKSEKDDSEGVE